MCECVCVCARLYVCGRAVTRTTAQLGALIRVWQPRSRHQLQVVCSGGDDLLYLLLIAMHSRDLCEGGGGGGDVRVCACLSHISSFCVTSIISSFLSFFFFSFLSIENSSYLFSFLPFHNHIVISSFLSCFLLHSCTEHINSSFFLPPFLPPFFIFFSFLYKTFHFTFLSSFYSSCSSSSSRHPTATTTTAAASFRMNVKKTEYLQAMRNVEMEKHLYHSFKCSLSCCITNVHTDTVGIYTLTHIYVQTYTHTYIHIHTYAISPLSCIFYVLKIEEKLQKYIYIRIHMYYICYL